MRKRVGALGPSVPCPPRKEQGYLKICKVAPGPAVKGVVISQEMIGLNMHWIGPRSQVCLAHRGVCLPCQEQMKVRWYGFIAIAVWPMWQPRLVQMTVGAVQNNALLELHNGDLRGRHIFLSRMGKGTGSPMKVELGDKVKVKEEIPTPDLAYCLRCTFGLREDEMEGPQYGLFTNGHAEGGEQ